MFEKMKALAGFFYIPFSPTIATTPTTTPTNRQTTEPTPGQHSPNTTQSPEPPALQTQFNSPNPPTTHLDNYPLQNLTITTNTSCQRPANNNTTPLPNTLQPQSSNTPTPTTSPNNNPKTKPQKPNKRDHTSLDPQNITPSPKTKKPKHKHNPKTKPTTPNTHTNPPPSPTASPYTATNSDPEYSPNYFIDTYPPDPQQSEDLTPTPTPTKQQRSVGTHYPNTKKEETTTRQRHNNATKAALQQEYFAERNTLREDTGNPNAELIQKKFLKQYNERHPNMEPLGSHAFSNAIHTNWSTDTIQFDPLAKANFKIPSLNNLTAQYIRTYWQKRDGLDIHLSNTEITYIAIRINDQLARLPEDQRQGYKIRPVKDTFGKFFKHTHPTLVRNDPLTLTRAAEITNTLTITQKQYPDLCQTLRVQLYEDKGYGLTTSKDIPKNTRIDTFRGTQTDEPTAPHLVDHTYTLQAHDKTIDASHPYSCFARYCNESFGCRTDNARFDTESDPEQIHIVATRPIKAWEEITLAYGPEYWLPYIRTYTLSPDLYNTITQTYGTHFRNHKATLPADYKTPNSDHHKPNIREKFDPATKVIYPKLHHNLSTPDSDEETAHSSSDDDSTYTYHNKH